MSNRCGSTDCASLQTEGLTVTRGARLRSHGIFSSRIRALPPGSIDTAKAFGYTTAHHFGLIALGD